MLHFFTPLCLMVLSFTLAQDGFLYDPSPPADAAFIRVIHANPTTDAERVSIGETRFDELSFSEESPYRVILEGTTSITMSSAEQDFTVEAGNFYTVALTQNGIKVIEDTVNENRAKALLTLYNLSDIPTVDLKTADGATDVILGVMPMSENSIEVNGISVALGVFSEGEALQLFDEVKLERGAAYSAFVMGSADSPTVIWVQSETSTE